MNEQLFPSDHPLVATSLNNVVCARESLGRFAEAEPLHVQRGDAATSVRCRTSRSGQQLRPTCIRPTSFRVPCRCRTITRTSPAIRQHVFMGDHPDVAQLLNSGTCPTVAWPSEGRQGVDDTGPGDVATACEPTTSFYRVESSIANCLVALGALMRPSCVAAKDSRNSAAKLPPEIPQLASSMSELVRTLRNFQHRPGRNGSRTHPPRVSVDPEKALLDLGHPEHWLVAHTMSLLGSTPRDRDDCRRNAGEDSRIQTPRGRTAVAGRLCHVAGRSARAGSGCRRGPQARSAERIITLYETYDKAEPDTGYDAKADEWRDKLPAEESTKATR